MMGPGTFYTLCLSDHIEWVTSCSRSCSWSELAERREGCICVPVILLCHLFSSLFHCLVVSVTASNFLSNIMYSVVGFLSNEIKDKALKGDK